MVGQTYRRNDSAKKKCMQAFQQQPYLILSWGQWQFRDSDIFCDSDKLEKNLSQKISHITITITNGNSYFKGCEVVIEDIFVINF